MRTPRDVVEVLYSAANYLSGHNFIQGMYYSDDGCRSKYGKKASGCCAKGAIYAVCGRTDPDEEAVELVSEYVGEDIDEFNDAPGRTKEEVIDALRGAASELEEIRENTPEYVRDEFDTSTGRIDVPDADELSQYV